MRFTWEVSRSKQILVHNQCHTIYKIKKSGKEWIISLLGKRGLDVRAHPETDPRQPLEEIQVEVLRQAVKLDDEKCDWACVWWRMSCIRASKRVAST